jgi:asparagine synthase (glutamine-hydrolysing)
MCGIFYYQCGAHNNHNHHRRISVEKYDQLFANFAKMAHRGPDNSRFQRHAAHNVRSVFGFHRLAINGLTADGNQPFEAAHCKLICNGEIYNFRELIARHDMEQSCAGSSDCEVIIHLYKRLGMEAMLNELDGVFAMVLYDGSTNRTYVARDPMGVRSLFIGTEDMNVGMGMGMGIDFSVASEMKSLSHCAPGRVAQFPAGCYYEYDNATSRGNYFAYYKYVSVDMVDVVNVRTQTKYRTRGSGSGSGSGSGTDDRKQPFSAAKLRNLLIDAVKKRLMSDRPIGALLSGGLDSSLVTAIICKHDARFANSPKQLNTYSIGLRGSVDLIWAKRVADFLGTTHHEVCLDEAAFLDAIEATITQIESYDTTTVRASVGNYLVSKYISNMTDDVVIYCGDMSDEIFGSYRGFINAGTADDFAIENERIVQDARFFDLLRSDKSISGCGLEARVPFADKALVEYVMSINPRHKRFNDGDYIEKAALRAAFDVLAPENAYLPQEALWRRKEAFSDGVSAQPSHPHLLEGSADSALVTRTWIDMIREHVAAKISDTEYLNERNKFRHNTPYDKESYYYRKVFEKHYPGRETVIPYFWRHPFCTELDPSARLLVERRCGGNNSSNQRSPGLSPALTPCLSTASIFNTSPSLDSASALTL